MISNIHAQLSSYLFVMRFEKKKTNSLVYILITEWRNALETPLSPSFIAPELENYL